MDKSQSASSNKNQNKEIKDRNFFASRLKKTKKNVLEPNKTAKFQTEKNINPKNKKIIRPSTTCYSPNINAFRFLFDNNKETINNTKWVLNLRYFEENLNKQISKLGEPNFYQEDSEKYRAKNLKKSNSQIIENNPNMNKYKYMFRRNNNNHGTFINFPMLKFNLTLRESNKKILKKWNSISTITNKFCYSNLPQDHLVGKITEKNIIRPYRIEYRKEDYNGDKIIKKAYTKDKVRAYNILGISTSSPPYNDKYPEKSYYPIYDLLNARNRNQQRIWYQIKLRTGLGKVDSSKGKKWKNY
jgi:hypothetical protein